MKKIILKSKSSEFVLRHIAIVDAKERFLCEQDKEAKKNFMTTPKSVKEVREDIKKSIREMNKKNPSGESFAIVVGGKFAGSISIDELNQRFAKHKGSIGYCLHKDFRGKGIGSKAIKIITDYAFKKYKLKRMATYTRDFNIGSRRALEKAGYKLEGILKKNKWKNGKYLNDCLYAIVR